MLIEGAEALRSENEVESIDRASNQPTLLSNWLPSRRPLRIALLAGASCPEVVIGEVLQRLAEFLS